MNNKITELNELISQLQTRNTDLLKKVTEKEEEINKLKFDLDHLNTFIITEIRNHVEEIDKLAKLPEENPSPIFRFSKRGRILIYCNGPGQNLLNQIDNSDNNETQLEWQKALVKIQENKNPITYHEIKLLDKIYLISIIDVKGSNYKNVYATDITHQKQVEEALRDSEEKYKYVIENASDIVYNTNEQGYFTYINPIAEARMGYKLEDINNKLFTELIHPDHRKRAIRVYYHQRIKKIPNTYLEFPVITKSGEVIWLGQNVQLIIDKGIVKGFTSIARDITERHNSQIELKLVNHQLSTLIENMNVGILLSDSDGKIALINRKFCELFGINNEPQNLIGYNFNSAMIKLRAMFSGKEKVLEEINACILSKKSQLNREVKLINNTILERDYIPISIDESHYSHIWIYKDVTEQRSAQEILQKSEEKYRRIIENMRLGLLVVDQNDIIVDANPSFLELTGYSKEEVIGWPANAIFLSKDEAKIVNDVTQFRQSGNSSAYELEILCKNGERKWIMISGAPIYDINKQYVGSIGIHLDITERKTNEDLLKDAQQKAEASKNAKEIFLANMSHEIRTPMNAIIGMADLLSESNLEHKEKSYINAIKVSSENLLVILNDILDFSKIDSGKLELEKHPFAFYTLIDNLLLQFELKLSNKNLTLLKEIDNRINFQFESDSTRLNQILINLLSNSIKFTDKGSITIRCNLIQETEDKQLIEFIVADTGIGIDATKIESIFESFKQEDSSINRKYGGTGLGLSICKQLVELFGGQLTVTSKKGEGSTFSFAIWLNKTSINPDNENSDELINKVKFTNTTILLVEDNKMNQLIAQTILEQSGISVDKANNGIEAVNMAKQRKYDLILMDIQMPEMDGMEATKMIRLDDKFIPIIALTANAIKGDREKYINIGMNDYVSKPFNKNELIKVISYHYNNSTRITKNTSTKSYDVKKLKETLNNNEEFVKEMISLFITESKDTVIKMNNYLNDKTYLKIQSQAHKIKASIDILEIDKLKLVVREIEKFDFDKNEGLFLDKVNHFLVELSAVIREIKADYLIE